MIGTVVDSINTNGIDAQLFELINVSLTAGLVSNRICQIGGAAGLVVDTTDVEAVGTREECCE